MLDDELLNHIVQQNSLSKLPNSVDLLQTINDFLIRVKWVPTAYIIKYIDKFAAVLQLKPKTGLPPRPNISYTTKKTSYQPVS